MKEVFGVDNICEVDKVRDAISDILIGKTANVGINALGNSLIDLYKYVENKNKQHARLCVEEFIKALQREFLNVPQASGDQGNKKNP
jgi:hypothetical protein